MIFAHPRATILVGFLLVLSGVILPLLMVIQVIQSTFLLNFISFGASVLGLLLGVVGAASYMKIHLYKKKKEE